LNWAIDGRANSSLLIVCAALWPPCPTGTVSKPAIAEKGYVSVGEPAVGGGAMIIALAHEMKRQGLNYQRQLYVTATDIDLRAVHMAYLQLSLLHIPAVVINGDTIRMIEYSRWYTPALVLEIFDHKAKS
jgi:hypothetical protein